jgi:hypothetical protein
MLGRASSEKKSMGRGKGCGADGWEGYSHPLNIRGKITNTTKEVVLPGGVIISGKKPVLLVRIHTGSRNNRRAFKSFIHKHGITCVIAGGSGVIPSEWSTWYEVSGGRALEDLTLMAYCLEWTYRVVPCS